MPAKVGFELRADTGFVRHSRGGRIFDDPEDRILRVVHHQGLQHADGIRGAAATRIVLGVGNDDGLRSAGGNPHGFL